VALPHRRRRDGEAPVGRLQQAERRPPKRGRRRTPRVPPPSSFRPVASDAGQRAGHCTLRMYVPELGRVVAVDHDVHGLAGRERHGHLGLDVAEGEVDVVVAGEGRGGLDAGVEHVQHGVVDGADGVERVVAGRRRGERPDVVGAVRQRARAVELVGEAGRVPPVGARHGAGPGLGRAGHGARGIGVAVRVEAIFGEVTVVVVAVVADRLGGAGRIRGAVRVVAVGVAVEVVVEAVAAVLDAGRVQHALGVFAVGVAVDVVVEAVAADLDAGAGAVAVVAVDVAVAVVVDVVAAVLRTRRQAVGVRAVRVAVEVAVDAVAARRLGGLHPGGGERVLAEVRGPAPVDHEDHGPAGRQVDHHLALVARGCRRRRRAHAAAAAGVESRS
jgi:hypothetical protein